MVFPWNLLLVLQCFVLTDGTLSANYMGRPPTSLRNGGVLVFTWALSMHLKPYSNHKILFSFIDIKDKTQRIFCSEACCIPNLFHPHVRDSYLLSDISHEQNFFSFLKWNGLLFSRSPYDCINARQFTSPFNIFILLNNLWLCLEFFPYLATL